MSFSSARTRSWKAGGSFVGNLGWGGSWFLIAKVIFHPPPKIRKIYAVREVVEPALHGTA